MTALLPLLVSAALAQEPIDIVATPPAPAIALVQARGAVSPPPPVVLEAPRLLPRITADARRLADPARK